MRQDHVAQSGRRISRGRQRRDRDRRQARQRNPDLQARDRDDVPELCVVPAHEHRGQCRLRPADAGHRQARPEASGCRGALPRAAHRRGRSPALPAFGRSTTACGAGARACHLSEGIAARRAVFSARQKFARIDADRDQGDPAPARRDHDLRDPRSKRSLEFVGSDRRHVRGTHSPGRYARTRSTAALPTGLSRPSSAM